MLERETREGFWWGELRKRDLGVDGRIILKWAVK
jgi:hypothetical protein